MTRSLLLLCSLALSTGALASAMVAAEPLAVGQPAVDFSLPVVGGEGEIQLSDEYPKGPVVIVVLRGYPGYQCPLCSAQVGSLVKAAEQLDELTQRVILVYPGEPSLLEQHAEEFMGANALPAPLVLVRDPGMKMVSDWNLRWTAPNETAYPATYIVDREGKVRWARISRTHGDRSTAEEILSQLKKL